MNIEIPFKYEVRGTATSTFDDGQIAVRLYTLREEPPAHLTAEEIATEIAYLERLNERRRG
jgi:hypothetical protein